MQDHHVLKTFLFALFVTLFIGCKSEPEPPKIEDSAEKIAENLANSLESIGKELDKRWGENVKKAEKRANKNTSEVIPYQELADYLPNMNNYKVFNEPNGQTLKAFGVSYSQLTQKYETLEGQKMSITIVDYNTAAALYAIAATALKSDFYLDNDEELVQSFDMGNDDIMGLESYKKKQRKANLILGVGSRFFITIEADNQQDTEFVKSVIQNMPLDKMIAL